jgi:hypothetical protein
VTGQYDDLVLYSLTDGRVMYVPPIVKKKIDEAGIGRGELFTITKAERKNGTRRTIEWLIGIDGTAVAKDPHRSARTGSGSQKGATSAVAPAPQRNGANHASLPTADSKGFLATGQGQSMLQAFSAAVDLAVSIARYAAGCGMQFQFSSADVREIGLSIYRSGK